MRHRARSGLVVATALLLAVAGAAAGACGDDGGPEATATEAATEASATPAASPTSQPEAREGGWPMLGHDLSSSFHNPNESLLSTTNVAELDEAWELDARGSVNGTAALAGDRVYVLAGDAAYALDAATGELLWENADVGGTSSPTYSDGIVYVTDRAPATLHALDADDGSELWQAEIDLHPEAAGFSSPVVAGQLAIVGSSSTEEFSASGDATFRGAAQGRASLLAFPGRRGRDHGGRGGSPAGAQGAGQGGAGPHPRADRGPLPRLPRQDAAGAARRGNHRLPAWTPACGPASS